MRKTTDNWSLALHNLRRRRRAAREAPRIARLICVWGPRAVALLIVLELGLLSPLSCVIHCAIQQMLAERPSIAFFLCGEHGLQLAQSMLETEPPPGPTPRASYELLHLGGALLLVISLLLARVTLRPERRIAPLMLPPPTPPPRLVCA